MPTKLWKNGGEKMPTKKFKDFYEDYTNDSERKFAVEQYGKQLDAAVLLTELREREGYTQKELATLANKSTSTIARIESGNMNVTFDTLAEIVNATGHVLEFKII